MTMTAWLGLMVGLALPAAAAIAALVWARGEDTAEIDDPDSPWGSC